MRSLASRRVRVPIAAQGTYTEIGRCQGYDTDRAEMRIPLNEEADGYLYQQAEFKQRAYGERKGGRKPRDDAAAMLRSD